MLLKLFRVCPATTRDRLVDSPHWLFRPLSRFQGAPGGQKPPGTRRTRRPEPGGGGGALNPTQRFDPIGPAAGRVATLWRRCCSVKSGPGTREQGNTIYGAPVPQPPPLGFSSGVNLTSEEKVQGGSMPTQLDACSARCLLSRRPADGAAACPSGGGRIDRPPPIRKEGRSSHQVPARR